MYSIQQRATVCASESLLINIMRNNFVATPDNVAHSPIRQTAARTARVISCKQRHFPLQCQAIQHPALLAHNTIQMLVQFVTLQL